MKKIIFGFSLVLVFSVFCFGQKNKTQPETDEPTQPQKVKKDKKNKSQNNQAILQSGTNIQAQLQKTLDVKNAEVGDQVVLTVNQSIKQDGQVVVPKGSKLIGRVTEVQQKTKNNAASRLGVVFDRLEGKNLSSPISASIVSITQAAAKTTIGDTAGADVTSSSNNSGTVSRGSGGGLLGGVGNTVGGAVNSTTNTVGGVTNTVGNTVGGTTQTLGRAVNGIQISQSSNTTANGGTMLSAQNKNLKIEKGATFSLQVNEKLQN
jgi:hypothetical protein